MSKHTAPSIYNIAGHGGFADALAQGLLDRFGVGHKNNDAFSLARGLVLLPNNRARRALQEAFIRLSGEGLLLPRMAVIGDLELDESTGAALESGAMMLDIPPAIHTLDRLLILARIIETESAARNKPVLAKEALRLAREFARTMDQLTVEEITLKSLFDLDVEPELSGHWQDSLGFFRIVAEKWQDELSAQGMVDEATRRNALFRGIADGWKSSAPDHFIVAAGITTSAPAVAHLLRTVAFLPDAMVVMPDIDLIMPDEEWDLLGPFNSDTDNTDLQPRRRAQETHPQYHLKLLLERMSIARGEILRWPRIGDTAAAAKRSRALSNAFAIPELTARWEQLDSAERSLAAVKTVEARTSAEEAQIAALLAREALEQPERRVAIITPDRAIATRISTHLARWEIQADDTAGQPLSKKPEGIFLLGLLETIADGFPPAEFLALLKHPLTMSGNQGASESASEGASESASEGASEGASESDSAGGGGEKSEADIARRRLIWLDNVRSFDLMLRGPRPAPGLHGIDALLVAVDDRQSKRREKLRPWWKDTRKIFEPLAAEMQGKLDWSGLLKEIRELARHLTGGSIWQGEAGRALADFFTDLEARAELGPRAIKLAELPGYFENFLGTVAVRPPYGGHPRVAIYGLLEARLQQAELVICCGLNEGVWPQAITPDPWLAPMVRKSLGLPAQERQIGLSAHDLVGAMGAPEVVLTRAQRDGSGPAIASRFLLRLKAMCGDNLKPHPHAMAWAEAMDRPQKFTRYERPAPSPSPEQRRVDISVTQVDKLVADPYAFYAQKIMGLSAIDMIDADPSAAWRGNIVHDLLEKWAKTGEYSAEFLEKEAEKFLNNRDSHPLMRTLWAPRLLEGLRWVAASVSNRLIHEITPVASEIKGKMEIANVPLSGVADRIDLLPDGTLAIIDYKTGGPPSNRAVKEGFNLQLGLLGAIAEIGGFDGIAGQVTGFEYWSLAKQSGGDAFGYSASPTNPRSKDRIEIDEMVDHAVAHFNTAVNQYILGDEPMLAKLHPDYAPYADYDQLMRLEEWYGRLPSDNREIDAGGAENG